MKERRDKAEMEATELSPPECQLFWRRLRQYQITRERAYDLALGFPTLDVTELKQQLAEGGNVHDLVPKMLWAFKEAYQLVTRSTADGILPRADDVHKRPAAAATGSHAPPPGCPQAISRRTRAAMSSPLCPTPLFSASSATIIAFLDVEVYYSAMRVYKISQHDMTHC